MLESGIARVEEWPTGHLTVLGAARRYSGGYSGGRGEIVVSAPVDHVFGALVRRSFTPSHVHVHVTEYTADELIELMPFIEPLALSVDDPAVFICTDQACEMPITDEAGLKNALRKLVPGRTGG